MKNFDLNVAGSIPPKDISIYSFLLLIFTVTNGGHFLEKHAFNWLSIIINVMRYIYIYYVHCLYSLNMKMWIRQSAWCQWNLRITTQSVVPMNFHSCHRYKAVVTSSRNVSYAQWFNQLLIFFQTNKTSIKSCLPKLLCGNYEGHP
jgi:hypothetical protein